MIIVTGGAGFIGSNLVTGLNRQGREDILVVDNLKDGRKFHNLVTTKINDYLDKNAFFALISKDEDFADKIDVVFHDGACTVTTEWDGQYMLQNNFEYSKVLLHYCTKRHIPFIYASSAAIYGANTNFQVVPKNEKPLNVYGYSKLLFDQYVRQHITKANSPVVGLRYFNVYGPHEQHKNNMASVMLHFNHQALQENKIKLFAASHGYKDGEQRRDFIHIDDVVAVNLWIWKELSRISGPAIFNLGTGQSRSFNDAAKAVLNWHQQHGRSINIEYIPFPEKLQDAYQCFTEADMNTLHTLGFNTKFKTLEKGVKEYLDWLNS